MKKIFIFTYYKKYRYLYIIKKIYLYIIKKIKKKKTFLISIFHFFLFIILIGKKMCAFK